MATKSIKDGNINLYLYKFVSICFSVRMDNLDGNSEGGKKQKKKR